MNARRSVASVALAMCVVASACGDDEVATAVTTPAAGTVSNAGATTGFCQAMSHLIVLLAPTGPTSPADTQATFAEAAGWFQQANDAAPPEIAADFAAYKIAYDEYVHYLTTVGFDLDAVFSTPEGTKLAIDTSHTLTPAIVQHVVDQCGLSFGDEAHAPPTT